MFLNWSTASSSASISSFCCFGRGCNIGREYLRLWIADSKRFFVFNKSSIIFFIAWQVLLDQCDGNISSWNVGLGGLFSIGVIDHKSDGVVGLVGIGEFGWFSVSDI